LGALQRLYDPTAGRITLDGKDLCALKQRSLRRHIGMVLQEALLFNDTIRHNIAYGRPEAGDADLLAAARAAHAHEFITRLPLGYDTIVGERGSKLSAGQRQRLAIAQAILKDPRILVLDEATSALDAETEASVRDALANLMRGRTTFIIAHRLASVTAADRVVVLKAGRIVEAGTHQDLLRMGGVYRSMVQLQIGGLTDVELRHAG
jgi:ATP-binding cassette, subfamily B, bacterial